MSVLAQEQIERIHTASLRVLAETGVKIDDPTVVDRLCQQGCRSAGGGVVRFPPEVVRHALELCPRRVKLASLDGQEIFLAAGGPSIFWTGNAVNLVVGDCVEPIDTTSFADLAHVIDGLEHVHALVGTSVADVPPPVRGLSGMRLIAENCLKHVRPCVYDPREIGGMLEMAHVLLGGRRLADYPIFSLGYTAISPLRWSSTAMGTFRESSGHGLPMMINAEPAGGVTAPATLAGELVLGNAEALSGVVICQVLEPGRPVVFNMGFAHVMDMQTAVMRTGAVENGLLQAAGAEIAAFHGLPSAAWLSTESMVPDGGAAAENVLTGLMHAMSRASIIWGIGNLESTKCMSLEAAVLGNDIAGALRRAQQGIQVDDDTLALDLIQELAQRSEYLSHPHTLAHFRKEYFYPHVLNRRPRGKWELRGRRTTFEEAAERVATLRKLPLRSAVSQSQSQALLAIEKKWRQALVG
jgi:trimethylamine---corrinoid protein Co-methyltransferase